MGFVKSWNRNSENDTISRWWDLQFWNLNWSPNKTYLVCTCTVRSCNCCKLDIGTSMPHWQLLHIGVVQHRNQPVCLPCPWLEPPHSHHVGKYIDLHMWNENKVAIFLSAQRLYPSWNTAEYCTHVIPQYSMVSHVHGPHRGWCWIPQYMDGAYRGCAGYHDTTVSCGISSRYSLGVRVGYCDILWYLM